MIDELAIDVFRKPQQTTQHRGIPRSVEVVGFAPLPRFSSSAECRSRAGRFRLRHEFDRDGTACIYCDAQVDA